MDLLTKVSIRGRVLCTDIGVGTTGESCPSNFGKGGGGSPVFSNGVRRMLFNRVPNLTGVGQTRLSLEDRVLLLSSVLLFFYFSYNIYLPFCVRIYLEWVSFELL